MFSEIKIKDYGQDYGQGRIWVMINDGIPSNDLVKKSFDSLDDALAWLQDYMRPNAHVAEPFRTTINQFGEVKQ